MMKSLVRKGFLQSFKTSAFTTPLAYFFSSFPKHEILSMPALSPTMTEGKIIKWVKNVGDLVQAGDIICQIETDKATVGFEVVAKGYLAKKSDNEDTIPLGTPLAVLTKKSADVPSFESFKFGDSSSQPVKTDSTPTQQNKSTPPPPPSKNTQAFPPHSVLKMPAASPTMTEGKIVKWNIKIGDKFDVGDSLFSIETDKAVVDYEATEKGILAKVIGQQNSSMTVNTPVAVVVKKADLIPKFQNFSASDFIGASTSEPKKETPKPQTSQNSKPQQPKVSLSKSSGDRIFVSPAAKSLAAEMNINLSSISGSGPDGRIIKQDVESYSKKQQSPAQTPAKTSSTSSKPPTHKSTQQLLNPFQEVPLTSMRKTIANRLAQSKRQIPHYQISMSIEMDKVNQLRAEINANQKENGTKVSVNDFIIKATALALRDYPDVNVHWNENSIKKFKYADVSVAVAINNGLITPIIYRAESQGLLQIAKSVKDLAKRAKQGKLEFHQYNGGTSTISNLGMFGIDTVTSIINLPQASILGIGKTAKKVLFDENAKDKQHPYRVAEVMEIIASCDHRAVDGALAAQWVMRIKKYLENPMNMLL